MPGLTPARRAARAAVRALPPGLRSAVRHRAGAGGEPGAALTVVLLCEAVDLPRLPDTLAGLARDAHTYAELLLAPVGDAAADAARAVLAERPDPRVRVLPATARWQDAANAGADAAVGRFLAFRRACDPHPRDSLAALVRSLEGSGSDLATGRIVQRTTPAVWLERASDAAHAAPGTGLDPERRPALAGDLGAGNKLLVTGRWRGAGRRFGPDDGWLLSPAVAGYLRAADGVDVLGRPVQEHLGGHGVRPFGARPNPLPDLPEWADRAGRVEEVLAGSSLADGWRTHVLDAALPGFLHDAERATDEHWRSLRELVERYAGADDALAGVRAESRVLLWLAAHGRRDDVVALAAELDRRDGDVPTTLPGDGTVLASWDALPADTPEQARRLGPAGTPLRAAVRHLHEREGRLDVELAVGVRQVDLVAATTELAATTAAGADVPLEVADDAAATRWGGSRLHRALAVRASVPEAASPLRLDLRVAGVARSADVALASPHRRHPRPDDSVRVTGLDLDGEHLRVSVEGPGRLHLVDDADERLGAVDAATPALLLRAPHFGRDRWLPTGHYRLLTEDGGVPAMAPDLVGRLPLDALGPRHRLHATIGPAGGLLLHLGPPLADDEAGPWAQTRLQEEYAADPGPVDARTAYFESYAGRTATDSPRAVHDELVARGTALTTYWGVADHAQAVPEGAEPVLLRSRRWYSLLARAGLLVLNTDVEPWFRRRDGQVLLQTFHGYPAKGMGRGQWEAADLPPSRVAEHRARGVDSWSVILTPTPEMTRHYREQYDYDGPALEHGYPRDDALVGPGAEETRRRTRALLGVRDDQTAVLYAPTWRENLAFRARRAEAGDLLDLEQAAAELGDSHVLLVRGHRFHRPRRLRGVVDVTDHPEVNDLILAADVAVLDYSSLRFDFALTGRPMVFLVPDLADYAAGTRRFLFPFEDSAPGPFVADTHEVVEQVRDVDALRARWAADLARFNETWQPWQDGRAAARVVDALARMVGPGLIG